MTRHSKAVHCNCLHPKKGWTHRVKRLKSQKKEIWVARCGRCTGIVKRFEKPL